MNPRSGAVTDVHTHVVPDTLPVIDDPIWPSMVVEDGGDRRLVFPDGSKRPLTPPAWDVEARTEDMDRLGISRHILSPMPAVLADVVSSPQAGDRVASAVNDAVAQFVTAAPDRFGGLGTLPVGSRDRVLGHISRCSEELGLDGFEISTEGLLRFMQEGIWGDVFRAISAAQLWLFIHPHDHMVAGRRGIRGRLSVAGVGMTTETALAAVELMRTALLGDDSRVLLAHGGGTLPYLLPRMDSLWESTVARSELPIPPSEAFTRWFYVDSCVHGANSLRCVASVVPADRLLYGSDYPFALHVPAANVQDTFDTATAAGILNRNAEVAGLGAGSTRTSQPAVTSVEAGRGRA